MQSAHPMVADELSNAHPRTQDSELDGVHKLQTGQDAMRRTTGAVCAVQGGQSCGSSYGRSGGQRLMGGGHVLLQQNSKADCSFEMGVGTANRAARAIESRSVPTSSASFSPRTGRCDSEADLSSTTR